MIVCKYTLIHAFSLQPSFAEYASQLQFNIIIASHHIIITSLWPLVGTEQSSSFIGKGCFRKGGFIGSKSDPTLHIGSFCVIFEGWSQILTQISKFGSKFPICPNFDGGAKSEGKVLQRDGDADSRNTCFRNPGGHCSDFPLR